MVKISNRPGFKILALSAIVIAGIIVYAGSLKGSFIYDDCSLVRDNVYVRDPSHAWRFFTEDIGSGDAVQYGFYRPLQMVSYAIDYSIWKLNVVGYHISNILLHILAALCVYSFINTLYGDKRLSSLAALFFVIHPIQSEAVAYISGRSDPLALIFMLLCFILYIKAAEAEDIKLYIFMISSYILALLSKEISLILPVLILLYHYTFRKRIRAGLFLPVLAAAFIYMVLRMTVLKALLANVVCRTTVWQRIPGFFVAITDYMRLLAAPFNLHMEYGRTVFTILNPKAIMGIAILSGSLIYAVKNRNKNRLVFFSIMWFFIALMPVSNLYPINAYMAEHWLYLPSIGFFLLLARGLNILYEKKAFKAAAIIIIAVLIVFWGALTIRQNSYWKDPLAFFAGTLKYAPDNPAVHHNLGIVNIKAGKPHDAIAAFRKALELDPRKEDTYNNLGIAYSNIGNKEDAIACFKKAIELDPNYAAAYNNLGLAYYNIGRVKEAEELYKKAMALNSNRADPYNNLAIIYSVTNRLDEAVELYKKAIRLRSDYTNAYANLSMVYYYQKRYDLAIKCCDKALELGYKIDPKFLEALKKYR